MTKPLGDAALQLPWLSPSAASLLALTKAPGPATWEAVRTDPGAVLLLIRHALPPASPSGLSLFSALVRDPAVLEAARAYLESPASPSGFVNWNRPEIRPAYAMALACAHLSFYLARQLGRCEPDHAWVGGLLTPLGWIAACAADPDRAGQLLAARQNRCNNPCELDAEGLARRLSWRWRLPPWLTAIVGYLALPAPVAANLGADPDLFRVVQLAVGLLEQQGAGLGLACGGSPAELLAELGLGKGPAEAACADIVARVRLQAALDGGPPSDLPLLLDVLRLAAENRRLGDLPVLERLRDEVDVLTRALHAQHRDEAERLQAGKLSALAELAAGASHEINNPLAVISGQAQYLLRKMAAGQTAAGNEPPAAPPAALRTALETIIGQTQRIHQILTDLMQFSRPPAPHKQLVDVAALVGEAAAALQPLAQERGVRLLCRGPEGPVTLYADSAQIGRAVASLLRNAVEAAPAQGWAGLRVELPRADRLDFIVEDSGRGPPAEDREHLFDPFYSGRKAGRGRGLGLPTAWRLARQHGGDVRLLACDEGVTRFVLSLPLAADQDALANASAPLPTSSVA